MVKPLQNVTFWKVVYPNIFFWKYIPLVVSKPYTKFQQLLLSKTAILEHPEVNFYRISLCRKSIILSCELPNERNYQLINYWVSCVWLRLSKLKYARLKRKFIWGVDSWSTISITDFAIRPGNVHLFIFVTQCFRIQGYETHNYGNFSKYAIN